MTAHGGDKCRWEERVSALLDGELPADEELLVRRHAVGCEPCNALGLVSIGQPQEVPGDRLDSILRVLPERLPMPIRIALAVVGSVLILGSLPEFVRGSTMGDTLHDLRHLAIWQVAIGAATFTAAVTMRLSRLVAVMVLMFLALTLVAGVYDLATGHRGPWTDPTHVVETVAVVLVLRLAWPHLGRSSTPQRRTRRVASDRA